MILSLQNASFSYVKGQPVFEDISLDLDKNMFFCILGANGCGKTTLIKCLASIYELQTGGLYFCGRNIGEMSRTARAQHIGCVPQEQAISLPFTVAQMVIIGRFPYLGYFSSPGKEDLEIAERAIEQVGIGRLKNKQFNQLSSGERQLALIARTLAQQPQIMLMDEPTSHLDFKNQNMIMRLVAELAQSGLSILMSTHMPDYVFSYATHAALMHNGRLLAVGEPHKTLNERNLSLVYDMPIKLYKITRDERTIVFCQPDYANGIL